MGALSERYSLSELPSITDTVFAGQPGAEPSSSSDGFWRRAGDAIQGAGGLFGQALMTAGAARDNFDYYFGDGVSLAEGTNANGRSLTDNRRPSAEAPASPDYLKLGLVLLTVLVVGAVVVKVVK